MAKKQAEVEINKKKKVRRKKRRRKGEKASLCDFFLSQTQRTQLFVYMPYLWIVHKRCTIAASRVVTRRDELERLDNRLG